MAYAEMIPRYQELRRLGLELNGQLTHILSKRNMMEGGRRLGVARGNTFALDTEDEIAVIADYCIHDLRHDGQNAIDRFLDSNRHQLTPEKVSYLTSYANAFYSIFEIESTEPGIGVHATDLIEDHEHFIFDVGFSQTAHPEFILASRIFTHEGITMTTGALLPVAPSMAPELIRKAKSDYRASSRLSFKTTAAIIRELLVNGAASKVAYNDVSDNLQAGMSSRP